MSDDILKETALTITFVGGVDNEVEKAKHMDKVMELLGAPKFGAETVKSGWDIVAPNGATLYTYSRDAMEFIEKALFNASIVDRFKEVYESDSYLNKEYIRETFFTSADRVYSAVGSIWSGHIEVNTSSSNSPRAQVDRVHKKNVLALKDRIVAMEHVLNVAYTCTMRKSNTVECTV